MQKNLDTVKIVGELMNILSALNGELGKYYQAHEKEVPFGWTYTKGQETKALVILKEEGDDYGELEKIVDGFNTFYLQWIKKHGCHANFIWTAVDGRHKRLDIAAVDFPVFRREVESERLSEVLKEQTMKDILGEKEGEQIETRDER
jgi:hypothetical protein